jgi:phenylacetate-CoA ligase
MDIYTPLCRNVVAPLWALKESSPYLRHLKLLEASQYLPLDEIRVNQLARLKALLVHSYKNSPYYRKKWQEIGFHPEDLKCLADIEKLPLLTKDDIRIEKDRIVARNIPAANLIQRETSGSTGVPLRFFVDEASQQFKRACTLRSNQWSGWRFGEKAAAIWGNPDPGKSFRAWLRNILLDRYDYLDTLKMDKADMLIFYNRQIRRAPTLLFGHAHSLYLFALFLESECLAVFPVKGIISTAMVLHDFERRKIESVFGRKVSNRYGCEEVSLIASECEAHEGLHINLDNLIVELIRDGKEVPSNVPGDIVVTDLSNYGMPFIRYRVGDVGLMSGQNCSCGRSLPLLKRVEGRIADYVITPEGSFISGISLTENFTTLLPEVRQMQIIQERIDLLVFNIVRGADFNRASEDRIAALVKERFGHRMMYRINEVTHIPQEASGKYRFCICKINHEFN